MLHNLAGFTTLDQQTDLLLHLQNVGQVDVLFCIYDSFTRTGRFEHAEEVIKECEKTGKNLLNGFPIVNYGIQGNRKLVESVDRPVGAAGPAVDSRLASEIAWLPAIHNCRISLSLSLKPTQKRPRSKKSWAISNISIDLQDTMKKEACR